MKRILIPFCVALALLTFSCAKEIRKAQISEPQYFEKSFTATPNAIYYALQWALKQNGYPIAGEDLHGGVIQSRFVPVKADSHYVAVFDRQDFGVSGAYHQLEARLIPEGEKTIVKIGSRPKSLVANLKSTGKEEKMILQKVGDYLRDSDVEITNLGVKE